MLSISTLIWLLLIVFACNDGEELLTAGAWVRQNQEKYTFAPKALRLDQNKPLTAQFAVAVAVVGSVLLTATIVGAKTFAATGQLHGLFVAAIVLIFLDGVKHILLSIGLRGYSSGVVSAALVQVPYSVYALHRFLAAGLVTWGEIIRDGAIGVVVIGPLLAAGFALGRLVVPARRTA
ncbi:MAG TPA: HXXEE domain-containing protein [Symbiobacteriaceae bacterium]|nr:HXXEE domain-containing protein [Symbiobacteriaceae bacterium]